MTFFQIIGPLPLVVQKGMKFVFFRLGAGLLASTLASFAIQIQAAGADADAFRAQFFELCDLADDKIVDTNRQGPFFVDSYAVRSLCAAYDLTGRLNYLDACRTWAARMVNFQQNMTPKGAYYMNYKRRPGAISGDWYSADSSSIGMAIIATAVRCHGKEQKRLLDSAREFAALVINRFVKPSGGVSDGLWSKSQDEWWCSTALFGSFLFNLYANTGDRQYLQAALHATQWLDRWEPGKDQPFPLSQQGPTMIFYVMENYSAGWPCISKDEIEQAKAFSKVEWCLDWIANQQKIPMDGRQWPVNKGWGMKFGGEPFHEFVFSRKLAGDKGLSKQGDLELERLGGLLFSAHPPQLNQLSTFMMLSYAERLNPGAVYKSLRN